MDVAWIRPLGLVVLAAFGAPEFESDVKPHAISFLDSGAYPEVTRTRGSYAERACSIRPMVTIISRFISTLRLLLTTLTRAPTRLASTWL